MRYGSRLLLACLLPVLSAVTLGAQQTGIVTGRVTEQGSGQPLVAAQVTIVGTTRGVVIRTKSQFWLSKYSTAGSGTVRLNQAG